MIVIVSVSAIVISRFIQVSFIVDNLEFFKELNVLLRLFVCTVDGENGFNEVLGKWKGIFSILQGIMLQNT